MLNYGIYSFYITCDYSTVHTVLTGTVFVLYSYRSFSCRKIIVTSGWGTKLEFFETSRAWRGATPHTVLFTA
jgi:hypothetical protein